MRQLFAASLALAVVAGCTGDGWPTGPAGSGVRVARSNAQQRFVLDGRVQLPGAFAVQATSTQVITSASVAA
ncbi:MAG: hypothetical protein H7338_08870, partial [Candidatus Sericytochromatia bacterium]|nr:hypothetical protein [Candidatus Sericytochromatia bacterium]